MGALISKREVVRFETVVLKSEKLPIFVNIYIGFLNKLLNIPKFVDVTCMFLVSTINMYKIKRQNNK